MSKTTFTCKACGSSFSVVVGQVNRLKKQSKEPLYCSLECFMPHMKLGREHKTTTKSTVKPTVLDICWAAGIWEGEGSVGKRSNVSVGQNNRWVVLRLKQLFGGAIYPNHSSSGKRHYQWYISGARGRGFLLTIYKFLSPLRRKQVRKGIK